MTKLSGRDVEQLLREDRLVQGEDWYLVSSQWWARVFGAETPRDGDAVGLTDDDSEGSDDPLAAATNGSVRVANESLVDLELSDRERGVAVLRPMLKHRQVLTGRLLFAWLGDRQVEGRDYRLVSQRVWNQFSHEFSFDWEIARPVVARGPAKQLIVEVNPVAFEVGDLFAG
ncbi:hypothetical protein BBJ28_00005013 [Nothophytophthora sp. Chile5]|nr:hypothetical protein BBJ28_00005013 [Nothophytophthora sp. Chile5]